MTKEENNRAYVVLKAGEEGAWTAIGTWHASNGSQAIRRAVADHEPGEGEGVYKAVPDRSWDPTFDVTVATRPVIEIGERDRS